jgi:hypothetical protein
MGTVKVSVDFNCANALSLREFVVLLEAERDHGEINYHATLKWLCRGVCLSKQFCYLFERYKIFHGKGLRKY